MINKCLKIKFKITQKHLCRREIDTNGTVLKTFSSKVAQISVFQLYRSSYLSHSFSHLEAETVMTQIHNCNYFTWKAMRYACNIETL